MKAILKFNLPEEDQEFNQALKGSSAHFVISEFFNFLRAEAKYGDKEVLNIEDLREKLYNLCSENNIEL